MADQYLPPEGDKLGFDLTGAGYSAPEGNRLAFDFRYRPPYIPPIGNQVPLAFGPAYTPPPGGQVALEFVPGEDGPVEDTQYLFPQALYATGYGYPLLIPSQFISPEGIASTAIVGAPHVQLLTRYLQATGIGSSQYGTAEVWNWNMQAWPPGFQSDAHGRPHIYNTARQIRVTGLVATAYGRPTAWNWLQFRNMQGFNSALYGQAFVQGGVKYVTPNGFSSAAYGRPSLVNTTADQFVSLSGRGIAAPGIGQPDVSPRSLFPFGIHGSIYGTALVQRTPAPYGFDTMVFGQPSIEYWTKYLHAAGIAPLEPGYPLVFDPTQKVFPSSVARSTVFGDTAVFNQSRFIHVPGEDYFEGSDWAQLENNRRPVLVAGFVATAYGNTEIRNRWPTVAPAGFDALRPSSPTETGIGYSIRYIYHSGIYRTAYGRPTVTKTPEIAPKGFAGESGTPTVWFRNRTLEAKGADAALIPEPDIWFRFRHLTAEGFASHAYGTPKLEHSTRVLGALGTSFMLLGRPKIEALNRTLAPEGIWEDFASNHMVGTDRWLQPIGFDAARFGARIIPEIQSLYPQGFSNPYGLATIWNATQLIAPAGFITVGQQPADRWGLSRVFNSDQYIVMYFDPDSHLNPPTWPLWTKIENRNRVMRTAGNDMSRLGTAQIDNNARPLLPPGISPPATAGGYKAGMVAYRIRQLRLEGVEAPYISTWAAVYNDAFVLGPSGMTATQFGQAALENSRRYFPYITASDQSAFGTPMIADRIRTLEFESRYSIAPPIIRLPEVKLYTRYLEPVGDEMFRQGWASLSIHWTIITPRWTHQDFFGWAEVRNLTPELRTRGRNTEEFGDTFVRLQWRPVAPDGTSMQLFGRTTIADRDRTLHIHGWRTGAIGDKLRVIRTGAPPYSTQYIWLDGTTESGEQEKDGNGIPPPGGNQQNIQVPRPTMNQKVIYVRQDSSETKFGTVVVTANSVRVEPGYWEQLVGDHIVSLKIREVLAGPFPDNQIYQPSPARITPHTIWAVMDAPEQARRNHPSNRLHYVDQNPNNNTWRKGVGNPAITLQHRSVRQGGSNNHAAIGRPTLANRRHYIYPTGIRAYRFGWHVIPGPQEIIQFSASSTQVFGRPTLSRPPYVGPQTVSGTGFVATAWGSNRVELFIREVHPVGYVATLMGTRRANDQPYMWQGLRVGPHVPFVAGGFYTELFGEPWVSFRVRELVAEGFDAFLSEYQLEEFDKRMRVRRVDPPRPREFVEAVGLEHSVLGVPNIRPGVHFIRPDGNADQFRKGAF